MPRELRIDVVVTLSDDPFEEAQEIVDARPMLEQLRTTFPNAKLTYGVVTPKPRAERPAAETKPGDE